MVTEVYDALLEAGASEEKARAAATVMHEPKFSAMAADIKLIQWMLRFNLAFSLAISMKLFLH